MPEFIEVHDAGSGEPLTLDANDIRFFVPITARSQPQIVQAAPAARCIIECKTRPQGLVVSDTYTHLRKLLGLSVNERRSLQDMGIETIHEMPR